MLVTVASELRMVIVMSALRIGAIRMKNKEKYAKEIVELACDGKSVAIDKRTGKIGSCDDISCSNCLFDEKRDCNETKKEWAESEYIENPVISKRDREFLEYIDDGFKCVVRDSDGVLKIFSSGDIVKCRESWEDEIGLIFWDELSGFNVQFPMVKWEDDEPWLIEDLKELEVVEDYGTD